MIYRVEYLLKNIDDNNAKANVIESMDDAIKGLTLTHNIGSKEVKHPEFTIEYSLRSHDSNIEIVFYIEPDNHAEFKLDYCNIAHQFISKTIGNRSPIDTILIQDELSGLIADNTYMLIHGLENTMREFTTRLLKREFNDEWDNKSTRNLYLKKKQTIDKLDKQDKQYEEREIKKQKLYKLNKGTNNEREINKTKKELKDIDKKLPKSRNILYNTDFIELGKILYENNQIKELTVDNIIESTNIYENDLTNFKKINYIDRFINDIIKFKDLKSEWCSLYEYRNKIAHNNQITFDQYKNIDTLTKKWRDTLQRSIEYIRFYDKAELNFNSVKSKDYKQAFNDYLEAAKQNISYLPNYKIALMYKSGKGVDKDISCSIYYFLKSYKQGSIQSLFEIGSIYLEKHNNNSAIKAFNRFLKVSENLQQQRENIAKAYINLGEIYEEKYLDTAPVEPDLNDDFKQAKQNYIDAINRSDYHIDIKSLASFKLADLYASTGIPDLMKEAFKGHKKLLDDYNYTPSKYEIAVMYEKGLGINSNIYLAEKWYIAAEFDGDDYARDRLAILYYAKGQKLLQLYKKRQEKCIKKGITSFLNKAIIRENFFAEQLLKELAVA